MAITYEQVATAAEQLTANGEPVSSRSIRAILPCSPNELGPLLRDWKAGRPTVKSADIVIDPAIAAAVIKQVQDAVDDARTQTEIRLRELEEELQDTQAVGRANEHTITELNAQVEVARTALSNRDGQVSALEKSLTETREALAVETRAKETSLKSLGQAEAKADSIPALEKKIVELTALVDTERTTRESRQVDIARLTAELEAAKKNIATETERVQGLQTHLDKAHADTETLRQQHADHLKSVNAELDKIRTEAHAAQVDKARLEAVEKSQKELIESLKKSLEAATNPATKPESVMQK